MYAEMCVLHSAMEKDLGEVGLFGLSLRTPSIIQDVIQSLPNNKLVFFIFC
jgi:hypothetical protein